MGKVVDYYKVLGIKKNATAEEIKNAYMAAVKKYHPNHNKDKSAEEQELAKRQFARARKAYRILSDTEERRKYNRALKKYNNHKRNIAYLGSAIAKIENAVINVCSKFKSTKKQGKYLRTGKDGSKVSKKSTTTKYSNGKYCKASTQKFDIMGGILKISNSFIEELSKLKVQKGDTFRKYVLRNKTNIAVGSIAAFLGVGSYAYMNSGNDNLDIILETKPSISTEYAGPETMPLETIETTAATEALDDTITLYRVHRVVEGDILSQFSKDSNTTIEELKRVNNTKSDYVVLGTDYIIPYIIEPEDLSFYTQTATYTPGISLEDYAKGYETNAETLALLNPEAVTFNGTTYTVATDSLVVPDFITKEEYEVLKAAERIKENTKNNK